MSVKKIILSEQDKHFIFTPLELIEIEIMTKEIMASSAIEGEELDKIDVENSIMKMILNRDLDKTS